jgi:hypothetical protein
MTDETGAWIVKPESDADPHEIGRLAVRKEVTDVAGHLSLVISDPDTLVAKLREQFSGPPIPYVYFTIMHGSRQLGTVAVLRQEAAVIGAALTRLYGGGT